MTATVYCIQPNCEFMCVANTGSDAQCLLSYSVLSCRWQRLPFV